MRPRVLVTRRLPVPPFAALCAACDVTAPDPDRTLPRAEVLALVRGRDGLLSQLNDAVDAELLDAAGPALRVVSNYAVGLNNVDVAAATARRVAVTHTPGVLTDATADLTWALLLDVVRRVSEGDRLTRSGGFTGWAPSFHLGGEVTGATLGIFGLGRIGQAVARRARGFAMRILYHQRTRLAPALEAELGAAYAGFDELLAESDILTLHAPLTPATRHRFGAAEFARMKPGAFLVNTSRGALVDEAALVAALRSGTLAGAGLDVYEREPALADGLAACERAVLAPHLGSATLATRTRMADLAVENLLAVLQGRRPPACVNPDVLDTAAAREA